MMLRRRALLAGSASLLAAPAIAQDWRASTMRFIPQANLSALDPIWTTATVTGNHAFYVFDSLYGCDAKLRAQPQMAEGHEASADGRVWRIRLRDGLKFHDGTPVLARDVAASLKRWAAREPFGQLLARAVESWGTSDDRTVEIRLTRPFPQLLAALGTASTPTFVMPERLAVTSPDAPVREMIGSGPYRFIAAEFDPGNRVVYEKFDGYVPRAEPPEWSTGAKIANFPRIEWHVIPDPATAYAALANGEMDWWERPFVDLRAKLAADPNIRMQIADPGGRIAFARLNCTQPPFDDARIRRALRLAVNQDDTMRAAQGDDTALWRVCRDLYPFGTEYHSDDNAALMPGNIEAGRAALREAGYAGQRAVVINPTDYPDIGPLGEVTADTMRKIGMNVDLQETDWGTVVQRRTNRENVDKGGWSVFHSTGPASAYANPAISALLRGQGAAGWFGWWRSDRVEELTAAWLDETDPARQRALALEVGRIGMAEAPTIPVGQFYIRTAFRSSIDGVLQGPSPYPWNLRRV